MEGIENIAIEFSETQVIYLRKVNRDSFGFVEIFCSWNFSKNNTLLPLNTMKNKKHELSTSSIIKNHSLLQPKHSFLQKCSVFKMFLLFNLVFVVLRKSNFTIQIFFHNFCFVIIAIIPKKLYNGSLLRFLLVNYFP